MRTSRYRVAALILTAVFLAAGLSALLGGSHAEREAVEGRPGARRPRVTERWRVALDVEMVGLPAADQAGVVVTAGESQVVAISPTGEVEWTTAVDGVLANPARLDDDLVFVAAERAVVALRRVDGAVLWAVSTGSDAPNRANRPVVAGDVVVVTAADGLVLGLDRGTGAPRWRTRLPTATTAEPSAGRTATVAPVVVVVGIGSWYGLDPATGAKLWSSDLGLYGTSSPVIYASGTQALAAVASGERILAVDAVTGAQKWNAPAEQSELYQVPVIAANGTELLVPDHWGRLTSYDPHDGRKFWSAAGADTLAEFGEPVLVSDRLVALPLDAAGPRLGSPTGSVRMVPPADGHGVADLPNRGLVVTTWGPSTNFVVLYEVR
ncbi:MAG TPA: PQQ-binding-like beta-propeller repeat protein [Acidimicrobiales bacterium]|nr:PQQ-binding-like beta-propeller repeat protein [Acidimicrobiales bacterium]